MTLVTGFAILTFVIAYLAINTPEKHGALQIGHYILVHVMALFTAFLAFAKESSNESASDLLAGFTGSYSWLVYLVSAYFGVFMLVKILQIFKTEK